MAATLTTNLGLKKPAETDAYDIKEMVNDNMEKIDQSAPILGTDITITV